MEDSHKLDNLLAARDILKSSIEKSKNLAFAFDQTGSRLTHTTHNLASLQANIQNMASKCAVYEIRVHVDRALGPAAAVLKVLDLVYELQDSLQIHPPACISAHLKSIRRLQEALKLLADNCRLVIMWLQDAVHILKNNTSEDDEEDWYLLRVSKVVKILAELQLFCQDGGGGVVSSAFDGLEIEYHRLLNQTDLSHPSNIQELQAISQVLAANNRLDRCTSIYAQVRIGKARATLQALNVEYLGIQLSEMDSVQNVEAYIYQWDKHMEFAVRNLLLSEYSLCREVYKDVGGEDVWMNCFAKIATQSGFIDIFDFGTSVCKCKKEALKLLALLKIFSTLDRLRVQFNELFNGKFCLNIQNKTRCLVKKVVDGASEIFWELLAQVELQRASDPPPDGNVPRLVSFVTDYCNQLLEEDISSILTRVLEISQMWNQANFEQGLLSNEIHSTIKALETNLESWAQSYNDTSLSYLFMMNNHWYLCNTTRGNKLGELMGKSWLWAYEESVEYYAALYLRESWEKLLVLLHEEELTLFPGGRAINREVVKKRIAIFCEAFDEMYKKQSKWILCDKALQWKTCQIIVEAIVPPYKSYLHRFMPGLDHEPHVKYTAERLAKLIGLLFQPKLGKYDTDGSKCTDLIGMKNAAAISHFSTPAAA